MLVFGGFVSIYAQVDDVNIAQQEERWRVELAETEKQIEALKQIIQQKQRESTTLERDIAILNAQISKSKLEIKARNLAISNLAEGISEKSGLIAELERKTNVQIISLAELLRKVNEMDSTSLVEIVLGYETLSDFFEDFSSFESIQKELKISLDDVKNTQGRTKKEKIELENKKAEETELKYMKELEQKKVLLRESEKKNILAVTNGEEKKYAEVLTERETRAAQIRAALFRLRDTDGIPFADALKYAEDAQFKTGVRAALILAILTQESDIGKNVGSCLVNNIKTGDGVGKNTGTPFEKIMKSPRDTEPFLSITIRLGRDWKMTPVSCPPTTSYYSGRGFGGGMGPSQFIPSTWEQMKSSVASIVGISADYLDPWNPEHSFMATAVYMKDLGAAASGYTAERNAACRYYSGSFCQVGRIPPNVFYGDAVIDKVEEIQENIDFLKGGF